MAIFNSYVKLPEGIKKGLVFAKKLVAPQVLLVACREFSAGGGILLSARWEEKGLGAGH